MQKIEAFAQAAGLLGAQLRRGVVTNSFLTAADCDREAKTGLYVYEANGELLVFRDRGTHYILNFFLQQGAHPTLPDVSKPVVTELAYRPKDADAMPANTYFETHSIVLKSGYCDALRDRHSQFFHTVPTPYNGESTADQRRIDFIYASQAVMREITDSRIIYDEFTATHSDHYPVMIEFRHYPSGKQASGVALK